MLTAEQRNALQNKGAQFYRVALQENRKLTDNEQAELADVERQLDADEYQTRHGGTPSDGQRRFTAPVETREGGRTVVLNREQRMSEHVRGSYPAEQDRLSLGRILRGYINGDWTGSEGEMRAMASSPTSAGGIMIPTPLAARVIDHARNRSAIMRAGASTVVMPTATLKMARSLTDPTAGWYDEAEAFVPSDMSFDSVTFVARKLAAFCVINSELLEDAQGIDNVIEMAIAKALALELDRVGLHGSGIAPEPLGLFSTPGVNTVTSTGTMTNFLKLSTAYHAIIRDNFEPNAIVYSARTAETISKFVTGITNDQTPLAPLEFWGKLQKVISNQVSDTLDTGSPATSVGSAIFVGDWQHLAVGMRSNLRIEVAREGSYSISGTAYSAFQKDQILLRAILRADSVCLQPSAFTVMSDVTA